MRNTFLTLVALCVLFLIPNTTFATSPDKSDSVSDSVSECVTDEIAPKRNFWFRNKCDRKITVIAYYYRNGWKFTKPLDIPAGGDAFAAEVKNSDGNIYYRVVSDDGKFSFPPSGAANTIRENYNGTDYDFKNVWLSADRVIIIECDDLRQAEDLADVNAKVSQGKGVGMYYENNYTDWARWYKVGKSEANQSAFIKNCKSIKLPSGWSITVYTGGGQTGSSNTFTSSQNGLTMAWSRRIKSIEVFNNNPKKKSSSLSGAVSVGDHYKVKINNNCIAPANVWLKFQKDDGNWVITGPATVMNGEGTPFYAEDTKNGYVYYHAEMGSNIWPKSGKGDRTYNGKEFKELLFTKFGDAIIDLNCPTLVASSQRNSNVQNVNKGQGIGLFQEGNYGGKASVLGKGEYENVTDLGLVNHDLGSIKIPPGWSITVYPYPFYAGTPHTFTEDVPTLQKDVRDNIFSVKIINNNKPNKGDAKEKKKGKKKGSSKNTGKTEGLSLNLLAKNLYTLDVDQTITEEDAWSRVKSVVNRSDFQRDDLDNQYHSVTTYWKVFPRKSNTLRVRFELQKGDDSEYSIRFFSEESGESGSTLSDGNWKSTNILPQECDKLLSDIKRKLGDY